MTSVKLFRRLATAALALASAALITPASATISTPFGGVSAGGFGLPSGNFAHGQDFGLINTSIWTSVNIPGLGLNAHQNVGFPGSDFGPFSWGLSGGGQQTMGIGGNPFALGISTPFGGINMGGFGLGHPCGFIGPCAPNGWGLNGAQNVGISTPFGGGSWGGFGISTPWGGAWGPGGFGLSAHQGLGLCGTFVLCNPQWGLNGAQNVGISTPWGSAWGPGGFGISTPWGGVSTPIIGLNGQQNIGFPGSNFGPFSWGLNQQGGAQPVFIPTMVPYPVQ